jgi:hypothetical protein
MSGVDVDDVWRAIGGLSAFRTGATHVVDSRSCVES